MNIQGLFPLGLTGLISLLPNGLSKLFQHYSSKVSILCLSAKKRQYGQTLKSIYDYWKNHSFDYMDFCQQSDVSVFNMLSRFVIVFLSRSKCFLISLLQSPSTVTLEHKKIICHCFHCFPIYLPWRRGSPVLHYLLEFAQIHIHWVSDAVWPSRCLCPLLLLPSVFPSIRVFSSESVPHIRWPKYWSFSFSISPFNEVMGLDAMILVF